MSNFAYSTAAVSWVKNGTHLRIYTSDGSRVVEKCWDGEWSNGAFAQEGQSVAATAWLDTSGQVHIRTYVSNLGKVTEYCWDKDRWYGGAFPSTPGSIASVTSWNDNALHIRVYVTQPDGRVTELCWDGGGPWYTGAYPG